MAAKTTSGAMRGRREPKPPKWVVHELWLEKYGAEYRAELLRRIKERLPELEALRVDAKAQWPPDRVLPVDSLDFEVSEVYYRLRPMTLIISQALKQLLPDRPVRKHFCSITAQGTGHNFDSTAPENLAKKSEAILNAFFIAYYYLEMACDAGRAAKPPGKRPPHWWTALLYLLHLEEP